MAENVHPDGTPMTDQEIADAQAAGRESAGIQAAREAAERNAGAAARIPDLERENALLRAVPGELLDTPLGKMFAKSYDGPKDRDSILEAAVEVGLVAGERPVVPPNPDDPSVLLQQTRQAVNQGAVPPMTPEQIAEQERLAHSPQERGLTDFQNALKEGRTRKQASAFFFDSMIGSAQKGDERAIWTGWSDQELEESRS